jgi:hypothetical protein
MTTVFHVRPTLYSRFTFTVNRVMTSLIAGSPKILKNQKRSVQAWFFSSGLSYTLHGAFEEADKAVDTIDATIQTARASDMGATYESGGEDSHDAQFFLEFVTCRAYTVKG